MPRRGREGEREGGREGEISDIKKAPLLHRAALKIEGRGDTLSQTGPTNSAVPVKISTYDGTNNTMRWEGVIGQNSPWGDSG